MNKRILLTLLAMPLALSNVYADEAPSGPTVRISGYGTAAMTATDTDEAQFARPNQATGAGKSARTGVDSNLGLQADVAINAWLSATGQGLVRRNATEQYGAELTWAFAKAKLSDELSVRVGRLGLPVFMISDYRNVGYANTMLRPPNEVYSQVPMQSIDGIDATYQHAFGATNLTAQLAVGSTTAKLAVGGGVVVKLDAKSVTALNIVAENGPLTLRFGRADTKISIDDSAAQNALIGGLRATGAGYHFPQLGTLADELVAHDKKASFTSVGAALDWKNIVLQSEYAKRKTDTYINDTTSWYLMAGYRVGKFLPYFSHADLSVDHVVANTVPASCPVGYPPACTPTLRALSAGVNRISNTGTQGAQSTNTVGVRWDFARSAALKVQIDRVTPHNGQGLFLAPAATFTGPVNVYAAAIDFVF